MDAINSEHCSYKSTKRYLQTLYTEGSHVIQGPGENAGLIDIGNGCAIALRIESHNHPSFVNPYEGAATGVGGILRDIFTMGARPIGLLDFLRFSDDNKGHELLREVVRGISDYGNTTGIPVVGGDVLFHSSYRHNCLVNVCAVGLVKKENIIYGNALNYGSVLIYVGGRTGKDGIGGSEMASKTLKDVDPKSIQSSDPFLEKLLMEACCELAEKNLVEGMQDMGAAGLLCSTSEVLQRGRTKTGKPLGCLLNLNSVPLKEYNMSMADVMLSESQERMLVVANPRNFPAILDIFKRWDLESRVIGLVTERNIYCARYHREIFSCGFDKLFPDLQEDWGDPSLTTWNNTPKEPSSEFVKTIWQQYDWMVGARTLKGPNVPGKYAVLDIPEAECELVITWGNSQSLLIETITFDVFVDAYTTLLSLGATPLGVTNCLNFSHPAKCMGDLKMTVTKMNEFCRTYNIPIVSGNVSLYNNSEVSSVIPTPIIVMVGTRTKEGKKHG